MGVLPFLLFGCLFGSGESVKIAIFVPYLANSQILFNKRVAETLADAGNDVTVYIQYFFEQKPPKVGFNDNVHVEYVNTSTGLDGEELNRMRAEMIFEDLPLWDKRMRTVAANTLELLKCCEKLITNKTFVERFVAARYDIAFTHSYMLCPLGLIHYAKIPSWIWLDSAMMLEYVATAIGLPVPPSYAMPVFMDSGENMTLYERTKSFLGHQLVDIFWKRILIDPETAMYRKHYGEDFPDLFELAKKAPIVMVNSNELYDYARPTLHKVVNIGGIGMKAADAKPLKEEYDRLVNASKDGHVVMAFGSVAEMHTIPDHWKDAFVHSFERYPNIQFFLRYEKDDLNDRLPKNVHISKWLPQSDLLAHKKCLGLISHGGYNSFQDAIYAGVPIVTVALFGDQPRNAHLAVKLGFGINLRKAEISRETVVAAIERLLNDKSLSRAASVIRDQTAKKPVSSEELLVRWTAFLAEFKTLDNLVPYGTQLGTVAYHSVDAIAILSLIAVVILVIVFIFLRCTFRLLRSGCRSLCGRCEKKEKTA